MMESRIARSSLSIIYQITGSSGEIFPGWKLIVSSWSCAVGPSGVGGVIKFNQEIPITSKILIEATIQSSPATTVAIKFPIPLTVAAINGAGQGILFEISSMYLGMNSTPGSIKLTCPSLAYLLQKGIFEVLKSGGTTRPDTVQGGDPARRDHVHVYIFVVVVPNTIPYD